MTQPLTLDSVVVAAPEQVSCDLAGEVAILNLQQGIYYGLNPVGARIWELIQQAKPVVEIRDTILEEYDVDAQVCENDLFELLNKLHQQKLIEVRSAITPGTAS